MQEPADISRKLLGFRTRQEHAVIQCVQESTFGYPVLLFDKNAMHHCNLSGRPAETENGDTQPNDERFAEGDAVRMVARSRVVCGKVRHNGSPYLAVSIGSV